MRVELRTFQEPAEGRPVGKMVVRPETPEELAELDDFRKHVGRHTGGDKFEVVFFPKKPRPEPGAGEAGG